MKLLDNDLNDVLNEISQNVRLRGLFLIGDNVDTETNNKVWSEVWAKVGNEVGNCTYV